jgi:peptidoglycan hydrolase-like protein with peptidoglycan-binding domain
MKAYTYLPAVLLLGVACATSSGAAREKGMSQTGDLSAEQVRMVQRSLTEAGYTTGLSGHLDDQTRKTLTAFQQAKGLQPSGALDESTAEALGLDPREVIPVRGENAVEQIELEEEWHGPSGS